jgi:hypothetical protein
MTHIHWVVRQNNLETPQEKEEVNKGEVHECDGWVLDLDTMVAVRDKILKLKYKSVTPQRRSRSYMSTRISTGHPPHPNHTTTHHTNVMGEFAIQTWWASYRHPSQRDLLGRDYYFVYYESRKREVKTKPIYVCRCNERLKTKTEKYTRLVYTGLHGELEHLKIKTTLIDEICASVMGEYVFLKWWVTHPWSCQRKSRTIYVMRVV